MRQCTSESEEKGHTCCEMHIYTSALQFAIGASNFIQMAPQDPSALYTVYHIIKLVEHFHQ